MIAAGELGALGGQGLEQSLSEGREFGVDPEVEAIALDQARVSEDAHVAANSTLATLSEQTEIADAQLALLAQQIKDLQAGRISESLSTLRPTGSVSRIKPFLDQLPSVLRAHVFQAQIGVSHV